MANRTNDLIEYLKNEHGSENIQSIDGMLAEQIGTDGYWVPVRIFVPLQHFAEAMASDTASTLPCPPPTASEPPAGIPDDLDCDPDPSEQSIITDAGREPPTPVKAEHSLDDKGMPLAKPPFSEALQAWLETVSRITRERYATHYPNLTPPTFTVDPRGVKYLRIWCNDSSASRSAYAFIEKSTGNVLKAESWKKPAKHARGNIYTSETGIGPQGCISYLK